MRRLTQMAKEAGFKEHNGVIYVTTINDDCAKELKAFAALVRADERNRTWRQEHWTEYERSIAAAERKRLHDKFMEIHKLQQHSNNYWHFAARKIMEE